MSNSDKDYWKKLKRELTWLENTINDKQVIYARILSWVFMWIGADYAVNGNMRIHTGEAMSMGYEIIHVKAPKQKINVNSFTEAELVGVIEYTPYNLWLINFLQISIIYHKGKYNFRGNKSVIVMETSGMNSCTENLRHIILHYFCRKDRIDKVEVRVEYCTKHLMLEDYLTGPLMD